MISPMTTDLVAAAPTKPTTISTAEIGAESSSNTVPVNFGK
jgi:hypothetical protein